jgi:hypothetical protein
VTTSYCPLTALRAGPLGPRLGHGFRGGTVRPVLALAFGVVPQIFTNIE